MFKNLAFTLLELMLAISILLILSAIAYPTYQGHLARSYRQSAQIQLLKLAQQLEIYHSEYHRYSGFTPAIKTPHYEIKIIAASEEHYLLQAIPNATQIKQDRNCGILTIDETGKRISNGKEDLKQCWP
jgi:type IV pilus assembly protein PilE